MMSWSKALPLADATQPEQLPTFKITTCFGCFSSKKLEELPAGLLVLTQMQGAELAGPFAAVDRSCAGAISKSLSEHGFRGRAGEHVLLNFTGKNTPFEHVLVVGLGPHTSFGQLTACSFFRLSIEVASSLKARHMLLAIPPRRLSEDVFSLRRTGAVLRCRVEERALRNELGELETIEIACSPQARRYLEEGLRVAGPRCHSCSDPKFQS